MKRYRIEFDLDRPASARVRKKLKAWKQEAEAPTGPASLRQPGPPAWFVTSTNCLMRSASTTGITTTSTR
jgi:hypothetical protein